MLQGILQTSRVDSDSLFWPVYLGCTAQQTTVKELASLYDKDEHVYYGEKGIITKMVKAGVLTESQRMKRSYKTNLDHGFTEPMWSQLLDPAFLSYFGHLWLLYVIQDRELIAERSREIFYVIRSQVVQNLSRTGEAIGRSNVAASVQDIINPRVAMEFIYPDYFLSVRLFDTLLRLRGLLYFAYALQKRKEEFHKLCENLDDAELVCVQTGSGEYPKECIEFYLDKFCEIGLDGKMKPLILEQILLHIDKENPLEKFRRDTNGV